MSVEALEKLEGRISKLARARRRLARLQRKLQSEADSIGSFRYCTMCHASALQPAGGQLPTGWTVHTCGDKADEHQYFCPQHSDCNPDVNPAIEWGHDGHSGLYG